MRHSVCHSGIHHRLADSKSTSNRYQNIPRYIFGILAGGNIFVQAIMIVVMETKKNISNLISGKASLTTGSSPTVAPTIINISKTKANQRFPFPGTGSVSLPLASNTNTEDSPRSLQKSHQPSPPAYPLRGDIHFPDFRQCSDRYA